jgi:phospholipase C
VLLFSVAGCGKGKVMMMNGPADMAMCVKLGADTKAAMRDSCTFAAGAKAADTLPITADQQHALPIKHIIVLMKENRSFDTMFGQLSKQGQPDAEPQPATFTNPDANGTMVAPFHQTNTCLPLDPPHQWMNMHNMVDNGAMDGFVKNGTLAVGPDDTTLANPPSDGHFTMSYFDQTDIPFYYWLASTFALADHDFASVRSGTWANRDYLVAGTSLGIMNTNDPPFDFLPAGTPLVFDELDKAKVSWQVYTDDNAPLEYSVSWSGRKQWDPTAKLYSLLSSATPEMDTLPAVVFVDATTAFKHPATDEHPPGDVQTGEAWTRMLVNAVVTSKVWPSTVMFYTYDEAGGFADHVPPPSNACIPSPDQTMFTELGVRIPLVAISPWAKPHYVSHTTHQHTSITRFIETVFDLPALTARDANSDALLDMFDFCTPALLTLPSTMPAAGTGECASPP